LLLPLIGISWDAKPTEVMVNLCAPPGTVSEKFPSEFVWVAAAESFAETVAPTTGCPLLSLTVPVIVFCCAKRTLAKKKKNSRYY